LHKKNETHLQILLADSKQSFWTTQKLFAIEVVAILEEVKNVMGIDGDVNPAACQLKIERRLMELNGLLH